MEEITKSLQEIVKNELKACEKNKTIPSKEVLDIVGLIITIENCRSM